MPIQGLSQDHIIPLQPISAPQAVNEESEMKERERRSKIEKNKREED